MPELLSCFLSGTQLSKAKQEKKSLGELKMSLKTVPVVELFIYIF